MIRAFVEQHAMEAAFLWSMRQHAVDSPQFDLPALARHDERIDAHLDGLRVAKQAGHAVAQRLCAMRRESGEMFTAAVLAFSVGAQRDRERVVALLESTPSMFEGMASALAWLPFREARSALEMLDGSKSSLARRAALAANGAHREDPGAALEPALRATSDSLLRIQALRTAGETLREDAAPVLRDALRSRDANVRFWSAWSLAALGDASGRKVLASAVDAGGPHATRAIAALHRLLDPERAHAWITALARKPTSARRAIEAMRLDGDPAWVPWLLETMQSPSLARAAAEAFVMITGRSIDDAFRDTPRVEGVATAVNDGRAPADPDELLPWPAIDSLARWWREHGDAFVPGRPTLLGRARTSEWLLEVLRIGNQRQRAVAAVLFARAARGRRASARRVFDVRAPGFRQAALLRRFDESTRNRAPLRRA